MEFADLWHGRTGRLGFLITLVIWSAAIAVLPFIAAKIAYGYAGGVDPAMAIERALITPPLLGIGFLIAGGPLVLSARRRMRELGLSGVWLLLYPLGPLQTLLLFAVAGASMDIVPLPIRSPLTALPFWVEMAFGAALAVLPSGDYLAQSRNRILRLGHAATACEGRLDRRTFAHHLAIGLGLTIVLYVFDYYFGALGLIRNFTRPGGHAVSNIPTVATPAIALLTIFITMFLASSTIRRLHDLNMRGWWISLFPFGLTSLTGFFFIIWFALIFLASPQLIAPMLLTPHTMVLGLHGLGCLILLVRLLSKRGSDLDNPYGSPVDPADRGSLPA
jgi:uncharacterized membrane protein YhaH (DUF805 family)